jgi:hypothetical protein
VDARRSTVRIQIALLGGLVSLFVACSTIGTSFHSDTATLSHLVVGKTTPEEAAGILGSQPYIRQNLPNGTIAWQWQSIKAGALVGVRRYSDRARLDERSCERVMTFDASAAKSAGMTLIV